MSEEKKKIQKAYRAETTSQRGEDAPQCRFAGFSGAWGKKKMGEVAGRFI